MFSGINQMKGSYFFKIIMDVNNSTSPLEVLSKIKSIDMCQDGSSLCNLFMYGIQAWMWWFLSHTKKSCWKSAPNLGLLVAPFEIVHSQRPNVHPMFHCVKKHFAPRPSNSLKTKKKPCPLPYIPYERLVPYSTYQF